MLKINIIGAGLAGSECALQLAKKGYKVHLYDIKGKACRNCLQQFAKE